MDLKKIKLIIWDLDGTFWDGILSANGQTVPKEECIFLVKKLTDCGIINSVCSKNDEAQAIERLTELGVREYFVFLSVNWAPKGERIREMLEQMRLRAENVLFLDDEAINREEALYYNPGLMTGDAGAIEELTAYFGAAAACDPEHKRLAPYRILEEKQKDRARAASNEEFLRQSNIRVEICSDCSAKLERIHELIMRTNQLNYTKKRSTREELLSLLEDGQVSCGYVTVCDRFGEYGIVGFYAMRGGRLIHFLFSCRTIGMGVEQYVYAKLGYPALETAGEVAVPLESRGCPDWINQEHCDTVQGRREQTGLCSTPHRVLLKGPCDLDAIFSYIEPSEAIDCEFTYVSQKTGVVIEQVNHTTHMVEAFSLSGEEKKRVIGELAFADEGMYSDLMYRYPYDIVFISILQDVNLGVYRRKETGELTVYAQGYYPLTDPGNWDKCISGDIYTAQCSLTREFLEEFAQKYEFMGVLSPQQTLENVRRIREHLRPETHLVVLLGTETEYEGNQNPAWSGKNLVYRELNSLIRQMCDGRADMDYIDVNRYIKGQESFHGHYNHFVVQVYYEMSKDIVALIRAHSGEKACSRSRRYVLSRKIKEKIKGILGR